MDEAESVNEVEHQYDKEDVNTDYDGVDKINFPCSEFTEEEDLAYYNDNWLESEHIIMGIVL